MTVKPIAGPTPDEDLLLALANTGHGEIDELGDALSLERWWQGLELVDPDAPTHAGTAEDLARLRAARDLVRAVTLQNNGVEVEPDVGALDGTALEFAWTNGPALRVPGSPTLAQHLTGAVLLAVVRATGRPGWHRVKACRGPDCAWVFVDRSRNGSRRWCQMSECGNRAKAAAFRARARHSSAR